MPDPFDPAEFDASPPSDPGADYRTLLDAMRKAGAEGVAQQVAALSRQIEQDARQRAEAGQQTEKALNDLLRAATQLQRVSAAIEWEHLKGWLYAALIGLGLIFAAALAYRWAQEPKIERQLYGCTARWDAKAQTCKGKWVPLYEQQP
jgi:hypothetical protein|nr:hypothetical protein [Sphingomonas sp. Y57]